MAIKIYGGELSSAKREHIERSSFMGEALSGFNYTKNN
jgi:hypothetical protein